jgi:hypothetical protein
MLRAASGLDRIRLRLDRVRAAVGEVDPAFLDTPALACAPLEAKAALAASGSRCRCSSESSATGGG